MCECELCIGLILTISTIAGFVLLILTCCFLKFNPESLDKYKDNWNLSPIKNITIKNNKCEESNYEYPLINSTFYGTFDYCDCSYSNVSKYKGKDFLDVCEKKYGEANCSTIVGQNKTQITKWRNRSICVHKMKDKNYDSLLGRTYYRTNISVDTEKNIFYKKEKDEEIPISSIEIKKKTTNTINNEICEDLSDNYQLCYNKSENAGNVIVDIKISQDKNGICISDNEGIFSENEFKYNRKKGSFSCQQRSGNITDDRYFKIDKDNYSYISLLTENGINKYSYLNLTNNDKVSLYGINYFGMKPSCFEKKIKVSVLFEKKITAVQVLCIISCVFSGFFALFTTISSISQDWNSESDGIHKFFAGFISILIIIAEIVLFIKTSNQAYFYSNNCFDDITFKSYWEMYWHIWISKILIGCCILIYGINLIYPSYMSDLIN